ncbi:MAG: sulfotransferase [Thiobacillus sp.]|nr:sulfotransferase [Thiobacillus sp.]
MNPLEHPQPPAIQNADFRGQRNPIFILGIVQRSGTNYLNNLLLKHPDVRSPGIVWEDFYLAPADHLNTYATSLQPSWNTNWTARLQNALGPDAVLRHLGDGLIHLMESQYRYCVEAGTQAPPSGEPVSLVTATPNTRNLDQFFRLFPEAAPVLIVRDGRAVVESGVRSFGWDYEEAMRMWVGSGQRILDFCQCPEHAERFLLTRYETLYLEPKNEMHRILDFLKLDSGRFDFDVCDTLGVMGSSDLKQDGTESLHWKYVDKPKSFNPLARASHWPEAMRQRFLYIAGPTMAALGYELPEADMANRPRWSRWNHVLDILYTLELKLRRRFPGSAALVKRVRYQMLKAPTPHPNSAHQAT